MAIHQDGRKFPTFVQVAVVWEGGDVALPKKRQPREVLEQWISAVNEGGRRLTAWELQFMESITEQFDNSGSLSEKQEEILERIYAEKVP